MYLAELSISNFRRLNDVSIKFQPGLNVIVGPNNIGKTAVIDALRALLPGADDPYPRFDGDDIHVAKGGKPQGEIVFKYTFSDLTLDDEADFLPALKHDANGKSSALVGIAYGSSDKTGRFRPRKWCGDHEEVGLTTSILENLRSVYLPPLRDASLGLRPSRTSQLSRLLQLLTDDAGKVEVANALKKLDDELRKHKLIVDTQDAITARHKAMLGNTLAQALEVGLSASDFQKLAARLSILVDAFEIESNGLGYNNLIFMAVVLSELAKNSDAAFRSLLVEEPEAHLHPQLQAVLLKYLSKIECKPGEKEVQVFVTSHSPNFASIAKLESIVCLVPAGNGVESFHPRLVKFEKGRKEKLERYLDVTRAELFFARRVIFVEGAAELLLINALASRCGFDLREHGVSLISVEGLNFDCFLPLFGKSAIKVPVAVITDADPQKVEVEGAEPVAIYPAATDVVEVSDNAKSMKKLEDEFIQVFHGVKTFEYDLALCSVNRTCMLSALKEIHPKIAATLESAVAAEQDDAAKAKTLFKGMFERDQNNVQKGRFAQALAAKLIEPGQDFVVPDYIRKAIKHACG